MRQLITIFVITFFCSGYTSAQEKKTNFGVKSGLNLSVFSASINSEASMKAGFHLGGYLRSSLSEKVFFRLEGYYSGQGQKDEYRSSPNGPSLGTTTTTVNYLNFPVLFEFGRKFHFQTGPQLGFLLSAREKGTIDNTTVDDDLKSIMKGTDFSFVLGLGINATEHFNIGARYNIGLNTIFKDVPSDFPDIKNRVLHFYVAYSF